MSKETPLWPHKIEVDADAIGWHLTCRYPTPAEKGRALAIKARIDRLAADGEANPIMGSSEEERIVALEQLLATEEGQRKLGRFNAAQEEILAEVGEKIIGLVAGCVETATNGKGPIDRASEIIKTTDVLWQDAHAVFEALFFRTSPIGEPEPTPEATEGS